MIQTLAWRRGVWRSHPGAYCAVRFGLNSFEDEYRIFAPGARRYLVECWTSSSAEAWRDAWSDLEQAN